MGLGLGAAGAAAKGKGMGMVRASPIVVHPLLAVRIPYLQCFTSSCSASPLLAVLLPLLAVLLPLLAVDEFHLRSTITGECM